MTIDTKERKILKIIEEIQKLEQHQVDNLQLLSENIRSHLQETNPFPNDRYHAYMMEILFSSCDDLWEICKRQSNELKEHFVDTQSRNVELFCSNFRAYLDRLRSPLLKYTKYIDLRYFILKNEETYNIRFKAFVDRATKDKALHLGLHHFFFSPIKHLTFAGLLLRRLLDNVTIDRDREHLERCLDMNVQLCSEVNIIPSQEKRQLRIFQFFYSLVYQQDTFYRLDLQNPDREIHNSGIEAEYSGNSERGTIIGTIRRPQVRLVLLDHVLLVVKKANSHTDQFEIWMDPVPLETLTFSRKSVTSRSMILKDHSKTNSAYRLIFVSPFVCMAFESVISLAREHRDEHQVYIMQTLTFKFNYPMQSMVSFVSKDGIGVYFVGTRNGVHLVENHKPRHSIEKPNVRQLAILEVSNLLLVLSEQTIYAYPLDMLLSKVTHYTPQEIELPVLEGVEFFRVVERSHKSIIMCKMRRRGYSYITLIEVRNNLSARFVGANGSKERDHWQHFLNNRGTMFQPYIVGDKCTFFIQSGVTHMQTYDDLLLLMRDQEIAVIELRETLTMDGYLNRRSLILNRPDWDFKSLKEFYEHRISPEYAKMEPRAVFNIDGRRLVCFDRLACYVNEFAMPEEHQVVVPEMTSSSSLHLFCWKAPVHHVKLDEPYIIGIGPTIVDIRDVRTGECVQIILGRNQELLNPTYLQKSSSCFIHDKESHGEDHYMSLERLATDQQRVDIT